MATLLDVVRAAKQLQDAARIAQGFPDLSRQVELAAAKVQVPADVDTALARALSGFQPTHDAVQRMQAQLSGMSGPSAHAKLVSQLARPALDASQSIKAALDQIHPNRDLATIVGRATEDWSVMFKASELANQRALLPLEAHMLRAFELSAVAEASLMRVRLGSAGSRLGLDARDLSQLISHHDVFAASYRTFYGGVSSTASSIVELPPPITQFPAEEFVNQAALIVSTSEVEPDVETEEVQQEVSQELAAQTTDQLAILVHRLDPALVGILDGARAALDAGLPDHVRHFSVSFRELFTQVLHSLAPDVQLAQWSRDAVHYDKGRPTRRARLLYISRNLEPLFGGFFIADVDAALKFLDAFQKGTHGVSPNFSRDQLVELGRRMEGLLRLLLVIRETT